VVGRQGDQRPQAPGGRLVIRIAISAEAFEAIAKTLPLGSVSYESAGKVIDLRKRLGAAP
jgi:hypothetical protein